MTVAELIEELRKYPPDMDVDVYDHRYDEPGELIVLKYYDDRINPNQLVLFPEYEDGEE